jgi:hypothetical protein
VRAGQGTYESAVDRVKENVSPFKVIAIGIARAERKNVGER